MIANISIRKILLFNFFPNLGNVFLNWANAMSKLEPYAMSVSE